MDNYENGTFAITGPNPTYLRSISLCSVTHNAWNLRPKSTTPNKSFKFWVLFMFLFKAISSKLVDIFQRLFLHKLPMV